MLLQRQVLLLQLLAPGRQVREEEGEAAARGGGEEGEGEEEEKADLFYLQTSLSDQQQRRDSRNSRYARIQSDAPAAPGMRVRQPAAPRENTPLCASVL